MYRESEREKKNCQKKEEGIKFFESIQNIFDNEFDRLFLNGPSIFGRFRFDLPSNL